MTDALDRVRAALAPAYALERELGAGGMATVYLAREVKHDRMVAIKVLKGDVAQSLGRERFVREIRLAARLNHPHILPLHDSGEADGFLYYVMPVMQGETLRARMIFSATLPIDEALRIASEVADALDYAHRHDIVHRDIKPENILLHEGHAVVADFGIGKALVAAASDTSTHTQLGVAVGTPAYMSPEQAAGDSVDGRSDLFSLGCTLFEMLTGEPPFTAPTLQGTISKRFHHVPPPVSASHPAVPTHVSRAIERMLEKSPDDRFTSGSMVALALRGEIALAPRREQPSIAVLPFANMSSEADNEFFSDGITDDIILALTRVRGLKVAARTSAFSFKGRNVGLAAVGESLGVRHVLQGSVRRAGKRVRVTAQLMSAVNGAQVWSERWDRDLDDIFAIQDEIAHAIVDHLEVALGLKGGDQLVERPTEDMQAYELYLRGREEIRRRTPTSVRTGLELLARAIARDAGYAQAWLATAEAYAALGVYGYETTATCREHAEVALEKAAVTGAAPADIALYRAMVKLYLRPDWPGADADLDEALAANPNGSLGGVMSAMWHASMGHEVPRTAAVSRFLAIDPLSPWAHSMAALSYFITGEFQASLALHEEALELDANALSSLWGSAMCFTHLGDMPAALRRIRRAVEVSGGAPTIVGMLSYILFAAGQAQEARAIAEGVLAQDPDHAYWELLAAIRSGDDDWLALALADAVEREAGCISLGTTIKHELEAMLFHPVHGAMVRRLHLFSQRPDVVARR